MLPLASRMPVSMASLLRSDSVNPLRNSSNCRGQEEKTVITLWHCYFVIVSLNTNNQYHTVLCVCARTRTHARNTEVPFVSPHPEKGSSQHACVYF